MKLMFKPKEIILNKEENATEELKKLFGFKDFFKLEMSAGVYKGGAFVYYKVPNEEAREEVIVSKRSHEGVTDLVKSIYDKPLYSNNLEILKDCNGNDWATYGLNGGASFYKLPPA